MRDCSAKTIHGKWCKRDATYLRGDEWYCCSHDPRTRQLQAQRKEERRHKINEIGITIRAAESGQKEGE